MRTLTRGYSFASAMLVLAVMATMLVVGGPASSGIFAKQILAGPGATSLGYLPRDVAMKKGAKAVFRNLDAAPHNVKSNAGLFSSGFPIGIGKSAPVVGVERLAVGTYGFYCTLHPNMKGTLTVKK